MSISLNTCLGRVRTVGARARLSLAFLPCSLLTVLLAEPSLATAAPVALSGVAGGTYRAHDLADMRRFYGEGLGFKEVRGPKGAARFAIGSRQYLEFLPGGLRGGVVRFEGVTFTTENLAALAADLKTRGITTKSSGPRSLEFRDVFGHLVSVVEVKPTRKAAKPAPGFAQQLQSVAMVAHHRDEAVAQKYYGETLGLEEVSRLNDKGGRPRFIKYKLPGPHGDLLEIFFVWGPQNPEGAGSAFHINFAVNDISTAYCALFTGGVADKDAHFPKVNPEKLWTIELRDPEEMRLEIQTTVPATEEIGTTLNLPCSGPAEEVSMFNGKNLDGWSGEPGYWRVEDGMIVGESKMYMHYNTFLWQKMLLKDFYLSVWIKQTPSRDRNSGIQFRSHHIDGTNHAIGYQADVGTALWGRIFHEEGRGHLFRLDTGEKAVDWEGWNHYEVLAVGHRLWSAVNGTLSAHIEDPVGELTGGLALQIHFDPQQVVRFRDFKLVRNPPIAIAGKTEDELVKGLIPVKVEAGLNLVNTGDKKK